jgi:hypothetical protein
MNGECVGDRLLNDLSIRDGLDVIDLLFQSYYLWCCKQMWYKYGNMTMSNVPTYF